MNQTLTLELNEQVFAAIQLQAKTIGVSPEQFAATLLEQQFTQGSLFCLDVETETTRAKFESHFGMLEADSIHADNESIDADLVKEYLNEE